jgi:hypothetical protein
MSITSIETTLELEQEGVTIFQADCILEVNYSVDREIGHSGYYVDSWHITEICFEGSAKDKDGVWQKTRTSISKGHPWFDILCACADADRIEEKLTTHMMDYA